MTYQSWNIKDYLQKDADPESVDHCINGKCSGCGSCWGYQCNKTLAQFARDMYGKNYTRGKRHYINLRLTFFGAENMEDQVNLTRVMAMKQKAAFGIDADEWL